MARPSPPLAKDPMVDRSLRHSLRDGIFFSAMIGALLQAFVLIPLALLPLALPTLALPMLITCAVVYYIGPNLGSPHWGSLMGDLVPESRRGRYFALRTRFSSLANFSALLGAGLTLHAFDALGKTYGGFLVIFRVTRIQPLSGMVFEVVGRFRRKP